ncbi:hypothetical protein IT970_11420 [Pseudoalteromonas sp. A41-2]|uniref:hypothetical protein n=1 Tax=Pseudoalteromonas sp. A41-2 TaxID=2785910 RepID=UPI0018C91EF7|nr:hypothetical protein [Pseudoalteromonas sp. A41-2]QPL42080.1 hypothetical protein IT970_11420 [Pseudoalteromonas sp. A41-2]
MKSETCFGKVSGKPLTQYYDEVEAQGAADYSKEHYGNDLIPYQCVKCDLWHLSPKSRQTPSQKCNRCTGGYGVEKESYRSKIEARKRANIIYDEQGISLRVYKCKYGNDWHLTKSWL